MSACRSDAEKSGSAAILSAWQTPKTPIPQPTTLLLSTENKKTTPVKAEGKEKSNKELMLSQPVTTKIDKPYPYSGSETRKYKRNKR